MTWTSEINVTDLAKKRISVSASAGDYSYIFATQATTPAATRNLIIAKVKELHTAAIAKQSAVSAIVDTVETEVKASLDAWSTE